MSAIPDPVDQPILTVEEAAVVLDISRNSAYEGVRTGAIPSIKVGRRVLVPTAKLVDLLGLSQIDTRVHNAAKTAPPRPQPEPRPAT